MDKIFLNELKIDTVIGIFVISNYSNESVIKSVAKRVQKFVENSSFKLVESLAEHVASIILDEFPVAWVKVRVNKPGAIRGSKGVGVEIEREKGSV